MGTKTELRKILKSKLASLSEQEYHQLSQKLSVNLNQLLNDLGVIQKKLVTGVFAPIQKEPKWFLGSVDGFEKLTAYPAMSSGAMVFRLARRNELSESEGFGVEILAPSESCPMVIPQVVIVPGLGFGPGGERLGRGKGFYDRYLAKKEIVKIGVAFELQIQNDIPTDSHDELMDFVVTDQKIYKTNR